MTVPLQDQFRVRAQMLPDATVLVGPGLLADSAGVRMVGPTVLAIAANTSGVRRTDRVVLDRTTASVTVIAGGTEPPALAEGQIALARVLMEPGVDLVLPGAIVDERALWVAGVGGAPAAAPFEPLVIRRVVHGFGENDPVKPIGVLTQLVFADAGISVPPSVSLSEQSTFVAPAGGLYQVTCAVAIRSTTRSIVSRVRLHSKSPGDAELRARTFSNAWADMGSTAVAIVSDVLALVAGEALFVYAQSPKAYDGGVLDIRQSNSGAEISFLAIQRIA